jgi:hypothetical protein
MPEPTPAPADAPEPTRAVETPEEAAVLENTANKAGEELSPSEISTEREVAGRTEGKPINDPPFTTEHELPNGHTLEQTPDGNLFKRCSTKCGIYNADGDLIGEVEAPTPVETPESTATNMETPEPVPSSTETPSAHEVELDARLNEARSWTDSELNARIEEIPKTNNPTDESNALRYERYRRDGGAKAFDEWFGISRGGRPGSPQHQADVTANNGPPNFLTAEPVGNRVPDGVGEFGQSVRIRGQDIDPGAGRVIVESDHTVYNGTMPNSEARAQMRDIRAAEPGATLVVTDLSNPSAPPLVYPPGTQPPPPGHLPLGQAPIVPYP